MTHLLPHAELFAILRITNCILLLLNVDTVWRTIITHLPMQKHVLG